MRITVAVLILCISFSPVWSLNLERFGSHDPDFFVHSLDVELHGNLALVTGNGGFMIYDISENLEYINRFDPGGGRGMAFFNCAANETVAYVMGRNNGMYIIDISDPNSPQQITRWQRQDQSLEDAAFYNDLLAVSAHQNGLYFLDVTDPGQPELSGTFEEVENCWAVDFDESGTLYVADGEGGLMILSYDEQPDLLARMETSGNAIDVKVSGGLCAVAVGAPGIDLFDVTDPAEPVLLTTMDTPTYAGHIGFDGNLIAVADWEEVLVYDVSNPQEPVLNGRRYTGYRAMGVDISGDNVYLADWSKFIGYAYGEIDGSDIAFSTRRIVPPDNELMDTSLYVYNFGQQQLEVERITCQAQQFDVDPDQFGLASGDSIEVSLTFQPSVRSSYAVRFSSNDTDDPSISITLESSGGLGVGERAPDFTAGILGGGEYRLSDMMGRIQLLIFWASW